MYLEEDKTFDEGQEGVVDPKDEQVDDVPTVDVEERKRNTFGKFSYEEDEEEDFEDEEEPEEQEEEEEEEEEVEPSESEDVEPAPTQKKQTPEENSAFAKLRRKEEELAKREATIREAEIQRQIENEMLSPEKIWEYAEENGITEEMAKKFLTQEAHLRTYQASIEHQAIETKRRLQMEELKKRDLFQHFESQIADVLVKNPDVDADIAYKYVLANNTDKLESIISSKLQKKSTANRQDTMKRRVIKGSVSSSSQRPALTSFVSEFNEFAGIDSREVEKHVRNKKKLMKGMM